MKPSQNCQFSNQSGFTLIEIMIVVVIIGILASVGWAFCPAYHLNPTYLSKAKLCVWLFYYLKTGTSPAT